MASGGGKRKVWLSWRPSEVLPALEYSRILKKMARPEKQSIFFFK